MQILFRTLLALYLAHLLADFVFQTHRLVEQKQRGQPFAYLAHGLIHYLCAILLAGFFIPGTIVALRTHLVIGGLTLAHLLIDLAKMRLAARHKAGKGAGACVADQLAHFLTVALAAWLLSPGVSFSVLAIVIASYRRAGNKFLAVPVIYLGVIFGGGYLIRFLTRSMAESVKTIEPRESGEQLQNEEHTSELQSHVNIVCRLLLEKKKKKHWAERTVYSVKLLNGNYSKLCTYCSG